MTKEVESVTLELLSNEDGRWVDITDEREGIIAIESIVCESNIGLARMQIIDTSDFFIVSLVMEPVTFFGLSLDRVKCISDSLQEYFLAQYVVVTTGFDQAGNASALTCRMRIVAPEVLRDNTPTAVLTSMCTDAVEEISLFAPYLLRVIDTFARSSAGTDKFPEMLAEALVEALDRSMHQLN